MTLASDSPIAPGLLAEVAEAVHATSAATVDLLTD